MIAFSQGWEPLPPTGFFPCLPFCLVLALTVVSNGNLSNLYLLKCCFKMVIPRPTWLSITISWEGIFGFHTNLFNWNFQKKFLSKAEEWVSDPSFGNHTYRWFKVTLFVRLAFAIYLVLNIHIYFLFIHSRNIIRVSMCQILLCMLEIQRRIGHCPWIQGV